MTCSCPSVKGYVTKKSSAFSPSGAKYGMQSMVHNQMMAHYRLIERAKSSIDNKPPKSINKFIKAQPKSRVPRKSRLSNHNDSLSDSFQSTSSKKVSSPARKSVPTNIFTSDDSDGSSSNNSPTKMYPSHSLEEDFLKRNITTNRAMSPLPLSESFIYKRSDSAISYRKPLDLKKQHRTSTPTYKTEMYVPEQSVGPLKGSQVNHDGYLVLFNNNTKKLMSSYNNDLLKKSLSTTQHIKASSVNSSFIEVNMSRSNFQSKPSFKDLNLSQSYQKIKEQESLIVEEQMYLNFIEDVTNDILVRGIFSDRVLCHVFEVHIAKNKGILNEERMMDLIEELKQDLGIIQSKSENKDLGIARNKSQNEHEKRSREILLKQNQFGNNVSTEKEIHHDYDENSEEFMSENDSLTVNTHIITAETSIWDSKRDDAHLDGNDNVNRKNVDYAEKIYGESKYESSDYEEVGSRCDGVDDNTAADDYNDDDYDDDGSGGDDDDGDGDGNSSNDGEENVNNDDEDDDDKF